MMTKIKFIQSFVLFLVLCCLQITQLSAEIERITVKWRSAACLQGCVNLLGDRFGRIPALDNYTLDQSQGQAELQWKPNIPFNLTAINNAMSYVGLAFEALRMRVRGTIQVEQKTISLISLGDGTAFILLSPISPEITRQNITENIVTHALTPELHSQLVDAATNNQIAVVEGPLFQSERAPPLYLIAERIRFVTPQ